MLQFKLHNRNKQIKIRISKWDDLFDSSWRRVSIQSWFHASFANIQYSIEPRGYRNVQQWPAEIAELTNCWTFSREWISPLLNYLFFCYSRIVENLSVISVCSSNPIQTIDNGIQYCNSNKKSTDKTCIARLIQTHALGCEKLDRNFIHGFFIVSSVRISCINGRRWSSSLACEDDRATLCWQF